METPHHQPHLYPHPRAYTITCLWPLLLMRSVPEIQILTENIMFYTKRANCTDTEQGSGLQPASPYSVVVPFDNGHWSIVVSIDKGFWSVVVSFDNGLWSVVVSFDKGFWSVVVSFDNGLWSVVVSFDNGLRSETSTVSILSGSASSLHYFLSAE